MLRNIYIFLSDGILLFDWAWNDLGQDPLLISGFCSALWMFSKQIGGIEFQMLKTKLYTFIGTSSKEYQIKIILIIDNVNDLSKYEDFLESIKNDFCKKHRIELIKIKNKQIPVKLNYFKNYSIDIKLITDQYFPEINHKKDIVVFS
ncbi:MAG: hypothetical protein ACTSQO_11575 [Candidatus Helarchaeota archaeon]